MDAWFGLGDFVLGPFDPGFSLGMAGWDNFTPPFVPSKSESSFDVGQPGPDATTTAGGGAVSDLDAGEVFAVGEF